MNANTDLLTLAGATPVASTAAPPTAPEKPIAQAGPDEFDWTADNPDIAIEHQPRTAIYRNPFDSIVIRQEAYIYGDDDPYVIFRPENVPALIERLRSFLAGRE